MKMDDNENQAQTATRRKVLHTICAAGLLSIGSLATGEPAMAETSIPATARRKCATCRFWGGTRRISADRKTVIASGTGTCNNPRSPAYQKQTRPDQGAPVWERWEALS